MPVTKRTLDELNKLGDDIYSRQVRPSLKPEDHGKFVAIDVDSGEFELDDDDYAAISRLRSRKPEADMWLMRAGYPTAYRNVTPLNARASASGGGSISRSHSRLCHAWDRQMFQTAVVLGLTLGCLGISWSEEVPPEPKAVNESLAGTRKLVQGSNDIFMTRLILPGEKILRSIVYSRDGKYAYLATKDGILRKVTVPELVEVARLRLGSCSDIAMAEGGILVAHSSTHRIFMVDKESLKVKFQNRISGITSVTAAEQTNVAFACSGRNWEILTTLDLARGEVSDQVKARRLGKPTISSPLPEGSSPLADFRWLKLTPDGKYLFVCSRETLHRFAVKGTSLTFEESGPPIGQGPKAIEISVDSKYVALPSGGGNQRVEGHPTVDYGTYIYSVGDLQSPQFGVQTGAYPRAIAWDPVANQIYAQNHETQLLVLDAKGVEKGKYNLIPVETDSVQFAVHPAGKKMFVVLENADLFWVEMTKE